MTFYHDTPENVADLAGQLAIPQSVAKCWLRAEGQSVDNPTNPLNILYYPTPLQNGQQGRFGTYPSAHAGLSDAARIIHTLSYYSALRAAIRTHNAMTIARAIEDSPWAAGHYGGGGSADGIIAKCVATTHKPTPPPLTRYYTVRPGDTLTGISKKMYGTTSLWRRIYEANARIIGPNPNLIKPGQRLRIPPK